MHVQLLECTRNAEDLVAAAARQCYNPGFIGDTYGRKIESPDALIRDVIKSGHMSVLEHASYTFGINGISRACSHQLVRFRVASFSQQSQRYCVIGDSTIPYITPPSITETASPVNNYRYHHLMSNIHNLYKSLIEDGVPKEDARFILPNACETNIVMTMNARELHHAFSLRCCNRAQWEIRDLFNQIRDLVMRESPIIFENVGPSCETTGICKEGKRSCGKHSEVES